MEDPLPHRVENHYHYHIVGVDQQDGGSRKTLALLLLVVASSLFAAAYFTYWGSIGFANPRANYTGDGAVTVGVENDGTGSTGDMDLYYANPIVISVSAFMDDNAVQYHVRFPSEYEGRRFVLVLVGTAMLAEPDVYPAPPNLQGRLSKCETSVLEGETVIPVLESCQVLTGLVPRGQSSDPPEESCGKVEEDHSKVTVMNVMGSSSGTIQQVDWAHQRISFPSLSGGGYIADSFDGVDLESDYVFTNDLSCYVLKLARDYGVSDEDRPSAEVNGPYISWRRGDPSPAPVAMAMLRDAAAAASIWAAVAAAFAGLGIGFIPVAYDAARRAIQTSKRSHKNQPTATPISNL